MGIEQEQRHVYYDQDLKIEAYNLGGIVQKFPNHFHECYVIGFVKRGKRQLWCKGKEYELHAKDLILFNPRDNHYCAPINGDILDYRALNIDVDIMADAIREITGKTKTLFFSQNVVYQSDITQSIDDLYHAIVTQAPKFEKEEAYYFLLEQILQEYACNIDELNIPEPNQQIKELCTYMEEHFEENITLDDLLSMTDFGKSYLLRSFTKQVGVSPYRYLQTVRLDRVKKLLEQGIPCVEAANRTGFADQSHFTNFFKEFIGLTPKQYQRIFTNNTQVVQKEMHNEE